MLYFSIEVELKRAAIVSSDEYLSSLDISNQKVLNLLGVIDLVSFLLGLIEISFLRVFINPISKRHSLEASDLTSTRVIRLVILLHLFLFVTK